MRRALAAMGCLLAAAPLPAQAQAGSDCQLSPQARAWAIDALTTQLWSDLYPERTWDHLAPRDVPPNLIEAFRGVRCVVAANLESGSDCSVRYSGTLAEVAYALF